MLLMVWSIKVIGMNAELELKKNFPVYAIWIQSGSTKEIWLLLLQNDLASGPGDVRTDQSVHGQLKATIFIYHHLYEAVEKEGERGPTTANEVFVWREARL